MNKPFSWFCKIFITPILRKLFIKEIKGIENVPDRNFILASNHESHLDQIANGAICVPREFYYIGQVDAYTGIEKFLRDLLYFIAGVIRLDRTSKKSKKRALEKAIKLLKEGACVIIYPEGTRTRTGKMQKGKWGVTKMLFETGVPVLPVAINGTFELLPPGGKLKIRRSVKIKIGEPLYFSKELKEIEKMKKDSEKYKKYLSDITEEIMKKIKTLKKEL